MRKMGYYRVRKYDEWIWAFWRPDKNKWSYQLEWLDKDFFDEIDESSNREYPLN